MSPASNPGSGINSGLLFASSLVTESNTCSISEAKNASFDLENIILANPGSSLADKVEDANAKVENAIIELEKTPPDNQAAAGNIVDAIGDIEASIGLVPGENAALIDIMDDLAGIARQIASDTIVAATGGDPDKISEAQQLLSEGDALRASGDYKDAASKYKDAIAKAEGA